VEGRSVVKLLFWLLMAAALFVAGEFFVPSFRRLLKDSGLFLLPPAVFSVLGLALALASWWGVPAGWLRRCLLLTGLSATGFLASIVLHNAFYGLAEAIEDVAVLSRLAGVLHAGFASGESVTFDPPVDVDGLDLGMIYVLVTCNRGVAFEQAWYS
jgi:hypothetical protein